MVDALVHLHDQGMVHKDIKLENMLVRDDLTFELIDFGFTETDVAEKQSIGSISNRGTIGYKAPETFKENRPYLEQEVSVKKTDVFSLAVVIFTTLVGCPPFWKGTISDKLYKNLMANSKEATRLFWRIHPAT